MEKRAIILLMLLVAAVIPYKVSGQGHVTDKHRLEDPVFGISYSYVKVHYEEMPIAIRQVCPEYNKGTFWTFAHVKRGSQDYFIVMGVRPGQDGDSFGAALVVEGSDCTVEDSNWMLSGFVPRSGFNPNARSGDLPGLGTPRLCAVGECHYELRTTEEESLLRELVRDALSRGAKAWGDEQFRNVVCASSVQEANLSAPIVQQELQKFCGTPR